MCNFRLKIMYFDNKMLLKLCNTHNFSSGHAALEVAACILYLFTPYKNCRTRSPASNNLDPNIYLPSLDGLERAIWLQALLRPSCKVVLSSLLSKK